MAGVSDVALDVEAVWDALDMVGALGGSPACIPWGFDGLEASKV